MDTPSITRSRRPFLLPVWLAFAAAGAFVIVGLLICLLAYRSATTTVVVIGLHSEAEQGSIQDPPRSADGERRAQRLAEMFGRAKGRGHLDGVYVSDARRTQQTAGPLLERIGRAPVILPAADVKG